MSEPATFPQLLAARAQRSGERRIALQEKRFGIWQPITWGEYSSRVRRLAHGLAALGLARGDVLAIVGDNRPEWLIAELSAQSLGAISLGLYPDASHSELADLLDRAGAKIVVAEDQEQVDKLIAAHDDGRLPRVEHVVYYDGRGLEHCEHGLLLAFDEVERRGDELAGERPGWLDAEIGRGAAGDVAIVAPTAGATGTPKLALLTYANLLAAARNLLAVDPIDPDDEYLSFLPLAWIGEQMLAVACGLQTGLTISFPEDAATVRADLREIGPRVLFSPPRTWEALASSVQTKLDDAGWLKRRAFRAAYALGERVADRRLHGEHLRVGLSLVYRLADVVALRPVRSHLGLSRLRRAYTGCAPVGPDVFRFFHTIGVNLKQVYGQTETCGIAVVHRDDDVRVDTVGIGVDGTEVRIADDGEILLRSATVFAGYLGNGDDGSVPLRDGWLHTGDAGYVDERGHLVVVDRAKDVLEAQDGTRFSPALIESKLKYSRYIEEAVVFGGGGRPHVAALLTIDADAVGSWAERRKLAYTSYADLAQKPEVHALVDEVVARANLDLPPAARVSRFALAPKQFDADDGELTRTRKVRRDAIAARYGAIVEALFGAAPDHSEALAGGRS
jgi:long-chain acyl-CoA synthetase